MTIIRSPLTGILAQLNISLSDQVAEGDEIAIIESMKMEIPVYAQATGRVVEVIAQVGVVVEEGDAIAKLQGE